MWKKMIKRDKIQTSLQNCVDDSLYSLKNANKAIKLYTTVQKPL